MKLPWDLGHSLQPVSHLKQYVECVSFNFLLGLNVLGTYREEVSWKDGQDFEGGESGSGKGGAGNQAWG